MTDDRIICPACGNDVWEPVVEDGTVTRRCSRCMWPMHPPYPMSPHQWKRDPANPMNQEPVS